MIVVPLKEGENIEKALKKFKRECHNQKQGNKKKRFPHSKSG